MDLDRELMELLRPASDLLRRALRRLDPDAVPASLRSVADSSARRLPPPLLRRSLQELDSSEWLRAEATADGDMAADSPSGLFLLRPEGWEARLRATAEEAERHRMERTRAELEKELEEAHARIAELEGTIKEGTEDVANAERRARDRLRGEVEAAARGRRRAEEEARRHAQEAARLASRVERLEAELATAEQRLEAVRQLLEKERRSAAQGPDQSASRSSFPDDPIEMAEELDRTFAQLRRPPAGPGPREEAPRRLALPPGVRPDQVEAIHWLMRHPLQWLIDGYNVAYQVADEPDATTRARLVAAAGRLASVAVGNSMVVMVFDSSVDTSALPADRRVRVVYAPSADEWIIDHARPGTVVVSSDREVRERAEPRGAIGVWAEALAGWISMGSTMGAGGIVPR